MKSAILPGQIIECKTAEIAALFQDEGKRCFIIGPKNVHDIYAPLITSSLGRRAKIYAGFGGECCESEIGRLVAGVKTHKSDFILAFGGGKAMDASKSVAARTGCRLAVLPTSASTCAAFTPHSVIYGEQGDFQTEDKHLKCPDKLILAEEILQEAPPRLLFSGIADASAKYYEFTFNGGSESSVAEMARDMLKRLFVGAPALKNQAPLPLILSLSRLCIVQTGLISSLGGEDFRASTAHALANGLTQSFPSFKEFSRMLHGELVGAGILACLFALNRVDELVMLRKLFSDFGIFDEFASCGQLDGEIFEKAANFAASSEKEFAKLKIKADDLINALNAVKLDSALSATAIREV